MIIYPSTIPAFIPPQTSSRGRSRSSILNLISQTHAQF